MAPRRPPTDDAALDPPRGSRNRQTPHTIYARLKRDISVGEISNGTRLLEAELAERYEVSRTPIRQALLALEQDGLVTRKGRSLAVRTQTTTEVMELYEVRELLEERAARLAARRSDESDRVVLHRLLARMDAEGTTTRDRYALNREFHLAIWRAAHQSVLLRTLERLYMNSVQGLSTTLGSEDRWKETIVEHRGMVDGILDGDEDRAAELVRRHLRSARDLRIEAALDRAEEA